MEQQYWQNKCSCVRPTLTPLREDNCNCAFISAATEKDVADEPILLHQREAQIVERQKRYHWLKFPDLGIPSGIDDGGKTNVLSANIPTDEKFDRVKNLDFTGDALKAGVALGLESAFTTLDSLHGYEELATTMGTPDLQLYQTDRWATDVEFGRQMLNGVNPVVIRQISSLPLNFPVTNEMVQGSLRGGTLGQEMKVSLLTFHHTGSFTIYGMEWVITLPSVCTACKQRCGCIYVQRARDADILNKTNLLSEDT